MGRGRAAGGPTRGEGVEMGSFFFFFFFFLGGGGRGGGEGMSVRTADKIPLPRPCSTSIPLE